MKRNKIIIIILCILMVISLILSIVGFLNKSNNKNNENKPEENKKVTPVEDDVVKYDERAIDAYFSKFGLCANGYNFKLNADESLKYSDLPRDFTNNIIYNYLVYSGKTTSNNNEKITSSNPKIDSFKKEDLIKAFNQVYGNVKFDIDDTFDLGDYSFEYDKKEDKYVSTIKEPYVCGGKMLPGYTVLSKEESEDKLYVDVIYYTFKFMVDNDGPKTIYYSTKNDKKYNDVNSIKENFSNFVIYRFVFIPYNKEYSFDSVELKN